ncbi:Asp23/Gls24 family envelope stress response protein [Marinilactibacillus kalidii]|uniref:Asp23/Gls24 family envelope stress response protein n=1 Tax=Marinilactibacillus kalidii TaxID=2820274 RepID=UPI001ABE2C37|nr:Asp23/Gls24 family envelope stress response protein [Marinilactibacillus kalidii]
MTVNLKTQFGNVEISNEVIATVVGGAATENFGIVGMASRKQVRDGLIEILNRENYSRGIVVRQEDEEIVIDVYIIVSYGTKISEVSKNVQEHVMYQLEANLGIKAKSVNVFVQGVRV